MMPIDHIVDILDPDQLYQGQGGADLVGQRNM
jgi:hypothetical protein